MTSAESPAADHRPAPVVVLSGNPRPGSRTTSFATALASEVARTLELAPDATPDGALDAVAEAVDVIDLAALPSDGPHAAQARSGAAAAVQAARVLIVASPTYKASYTGLLKSFLDQLPPSALSGIVAVPLMTAGAPGHSLAADVHLRPVLLELGAWTPTAAVVALEPDLADPDPLISGWLLRNGPVLRAVVAAQLVGS